MSDSNDDCNSLACKGGKKLTCFRYFDQKWAGKGVDCGYKIVSFSLSDFQNRIIPLTIKMMMGGQI